MSEKTGPTNLEVRRWSAPLVRAPPYTAEEFERLRRDYKAELDGRSPQDAESYRWSHNAIRVVEFDRYVRARRREDKRTRQVFYDLLGPEGVDYVVTQHQAHVLGQTPPDGDPVLDLPIRMLYRSELEQIGKQCLPQYIVDGFVQWEWSDELSVTEFNAAQEHYEACHDCAFDFHLERLGQLLAAGQNIGREQLVDVLRRAGSNYQQRLAGSTRS